jgi:hypothetical protein
MPSRRWLSGGTLIGLAVVVATIYGIWKLEQISGAIASLFRLSRSITTQVSSFQGSEVMRTPGGLLEVASLKAYERFTRRDSLKIAGERIHLGTTVSEIEAAVHFRYHIEMAKEWPLTCDKGSCVVRAGKILPTLPAAIYSDEVRKRTHSGWGRFNKNENLEALERSLTGELSTRAVSDRNMAAATEAGRKTVGEFASTWLVRNRLKPGEVTPRIVVLFPGETEQSAAAAL